MAHQRDELCRLCIGPKRPLGTHEIVDNWLRDDETIRALGQPICLDEDSPPLTGTLLCRRHAEDAAHLGYTVIKLEGKG